MRKIFKTGGLIFNILIFIEGFLLFPAVGKAQENNCIQPWPENPRYWQYKGEPVFLIGGTDDDNLFQWHADALREQLDLLVSVGGNYVRNTMSDRPVEPETESHLIDKLETAYAFKKLDNGKYDLTQWNEEYFRRLRRFLDETAARDIIVQIELWDGHDFLDTNERVRWKAHPFNPVNNINYTAEETTLPEEWQISYRERIHPIHLTVPGLNDDSVVCRFLRAYIGKVLSVTLDYDHVLYTVQNESWSPHYWSKYWAEFIHEQAEVRGKKVYVADMRFTPSVEPVFDGRFFNYADISQSAGENRRGEAHYKAISRNWKALSDAPCPLNSVKQYGGKTSWTMGAEAGMQRVCRSVFCGQAAVRFHRPPSGIGLMEQAQAILTSLRKLTDLTDIVRCHPHQEVAELLYNRDEDEAYLLADPGRVYTVFFPGEGQVDLDVSAVEGMVNVRWLEIGTARWHEPLLLEAAKISLRPPAPGLWAALIVPADR